MTDRTIDFKKYTSIFTLLVVNFLFYVKYINRISDYYLLIAIFCLLLFTSLLFTSNFVSKRFSDSSLKTFNYLAFGLLVLGSMALLYKMPIESINVDRWQIITAFWETFERGEYAFGFQLDTENKPGAMPFYFLLTYPFYKLGIFGLMPIVALLIFVFTLKYANVKTGVLSVCFWYLLLSPSFLWEIMSRSTLYLNAVLVLFSVVYFLKQDKSDTKRLILSGVLFGFFLSIRFVFLLGYIVLALYALRTRKINLKGALLVALSAIVSFAFTFLPFLWGHIDEFFKINPFIVQSTFLVPFGYTVGFVLLAFAFSFFCKKDGDVYFFSGLSLFISIAVYFVYLIITKGFHKTYFDSLADISYFIFGVPFALFYFAKKLNDPEN